MAVAGGSGRRATGAAVVPAAAAVQRGASGTRLGVGTPGAQAQGRHPDAAVGRVQGGASGRVSVHDVLRALPGLAGVAWTW